MVTSTHEASHRIFKEHPEALTPVFEALGVPPPRKSDIKELTPDTTEIRPLERRVDTVLKVEPPEGESFLLAIEAQTKQDPDKATSWAYYVAHLRAKYDMPVLLVAICRDRHTAIWAAGPFECAVGPWTTQVTRPFVLGPNTLPEITDEATAIQQPALAALSAIVHSESRKIPAILEVLASGWEKFDTDTTKYWFEVLEVGLENTPARKKWRELMAVITNFPGRGTFIEETYLEGKADGKAEDVLRVLKTRGIPVPDEVRQRVSGCADPDTLDRWLDQAVTVSDAEDLFAEDPKDVPDQA
ncbi:hypothetical protein ACFYS7_08855 [Streptomyces avermitilis]|uniref:hypothetical protein n=1 Tax=Streptomyces avermitilis TaxID=33903 RepID=UPI003695E2B2